MTQPEQAVGGEPSAPLMTPEERLNAALDTSAQESAEEQDAPAAEVEEPTVAEEGETDPEIDVEVIEAEAEPPIDAPVSWSAEEKTAFAELPRALQETVIRRESEREKFVQSKAQEAARERQALQAEALQYAEQVRAQNAAELERYAQQFEVRPPDARLYAQDPMAYAQQLEAYQHYTAQREQAQRDADKARAEAQQLAAVREQHEAEQFRQRLEAELPEAFDPANGQKFLAGLAATAEALGYDINAINQSSVEELKALKIVSDYRSKAEKYDALMKRQMERVRSGKSPPPIAKPGVAQGPGAQQQQRYAADREAMKRGDKDAATRVLDSFFNK